jgi:uncharacterized repeat protein (TIGR01451 family)
MEADNADNMASDKLEPGGIRQFLRLGRLLGACTIAGGALLALFLLLNHPALVEADTLIKVVTPNSTGYVDVSLGQDIPGCGTQSMACKTIQYAIDHTTYTVLHLAQGEYVESVVIPRDVTLQGGWSSNFTDQHPRDYETVVSGPFGTGADVIAIGPATTVVLDGLTIRQGDDGVQLDAGASARLINLHVQGTRDEGIESNGAWLVVSNTHIFDVGDNGILVEVGSAEIYSSTIRDTGVVTTYNSRRGVYLRGYGPCVISGTLIYNTGDDGIRVRDANLSSILNNRVYSTTADGIQMDDIGFAMVASNTVSASARDGLKLDGGAFATLRGNRVYDVASQAIQVQNGQVVTVEQNIVYGMGSAGILAENVGGTVLIRNNEVYSSSGLAEDGVHVNPGVAATVLSNVIHDVTDDAVDFKGRSGVVKDNRIYAVGDTGVWISGTVSVSATHNHVWDVGQGIVAENSGTVWIAHNALSRTVTGTAAVYVGAGVAGTIEHNRVYSVAGDGINFQGTNGWVRYNEVQQTGDQGINVNADHTTLLENKIYRTGSEGLRVRSGSTVIVQDNIIHEMLGTGMDGIRIEPNVGAIIVGNTVYSATDDGITFNGTVGDISHNYIYDNGASGVDIDADRVTLSANRLFNNGVAGIEIEQALDFTITNNLVGENGDGGVWLLGDRPSNGRLVNNSLVGHPSVPVGVGVHVLSDTVTLTAANNIIISHTTGLSLAQGAAVTLRYNDLWNNGSNQGTVIGPDTLQQDPLLLDPVGRDYHLLNGSPCIDAGWDLLVSEFPFDFEGHPRMGRIEVGADEVGLWVAKTAPGWVPPANPITYALTISNYYNNPLNNLVITDAVPVGASLVSVQNGTNLLTDSQVVWIVDDIAATTGTVQVSFVVTATETVTNDRYRVVTSTQGLDSKVGPPVVTVVEWRVLLPLILKDQNG